MATARGLSFLEQCLKVDLEQATNSFRGGQCDQIGRFIGLWAPINLPKPPTFLGNFCKGVKIFNFSSEIIFGKLLLLFGDIFIGHTGGGPKNIISSWF